MSIRIVAADDHSVVLNGIAALLVLEPDFEIAGLCVDGLEAIEEVSRSQPDVLLMDAVMPNCTGIEACRILRKGGFSTPILILAASLDDENLETLVDHSVNGILLKEAAATDLVSAIRTVAAGGRWIAPALGGRIAGLFSRPGNDEAGLTPREREVANLAASGATNKRIAGLLDLAESTVKMHLHSAFRKLDVRNRTELSIAIRTAGMPLP